MQKLIDRIGTQSHKYRLLLQFTRVQLQAAVDTAFHYRLVLQRDSKKYSTNYFKLKPGKATPINEPINIKATLFYDAKRQSYQSKEFEVALMRRQEQGQIEAMKVMLPVDRYLTTDKVVQLEDGKGSKLQIYITAERVEGRSERGSDDGSVQKTKSIEGRKYFRGYPMGDTTAANNNALAINSISRISEKPIEENKKSIIELVRFEDEEEGVNIESTIKEASKTAIQSPQCQPVKKHKPIFAVERTGSKSPSFRDIGNVNEKLPVKKMTSLRKQHQEHSISSAPRSADPMRTQTISSEQSQRHSKQQSAEVDPSSAVPVMQESLTKTPTLKKNLSEVEQQLAESMLRNSSVLEALRMQQHQQLNKQRTDHSDLKALNARLQYQCEDLQRQNKDVKERNQQLIVKLKRTQGQLRDVKQIRDHLLNENSQMRVKVELAQKECSSANGARSELDNEFTSLRRQLKQAQEAIARQSAQIIELESQRDMLVGKQSELISKYQRVFNDLSAERSVNEELRRNCKLAEQNLQHIVRQKEQENSLLRNEIKHLEFMMVKPDDHLEDREKQMLKERLERLLRDLKEQAEENEGIQNLLKNDIKLKDREIAAITELLERTQKQVQQDEQLWFGKERSLSKALEQKDRRIAEVSKELERTQLRLQQMNRFVESEKIDLLGKMQLLTSELTRLRDVDQELAATELKHREADTKMRLFANECAELKVELVRLQQSYKKVLAEREDSAKHIKQLQLQLVRTNVKLAQMVEAVFEKDPILAQRLTQLRPAE